jgi:NitT/TauT family transport system ATP-binding protein
MTSPSAGSPLLQAEDITKVFGGSAGAVRALETVSTSIQEGEFVALLGPSGCGKSTLLSILSGLDQPTHGRILFDGSEVTRPLAQMGFVFQRDLLLEWRSALDNVLLQYAMRGEDPSPHGDAARDLLASVGLAGFEDKYPWQLSGGMRQRVAICRALIHEPAVLFMDEPFGAVDALTRERLNADLSKLCSTPEAKTVVFVTHDIDEAVFLADRVMVLSPRPGKIVAEQRVDLPKPRVNALRSTEGFLHEVAVARQLLTEHGLFDA